MPWCVCGGPRTAGDLFFLVVWVLGLNSGHSEGKCLNLVSHLLLPSPALYAWLLLLLFSKTGFLYGMALAALELAL